MDKKTANGNKKSNTNCMASQKSKQNTNNKKGPVYICEVCKDIFQTPGSLKMHSLFHIKCNDVKFTCALCGATFKSNEELMNHKLVHDSEDLTFTCKKCKLDCSSHHDYLQHIAKHIKTPPYKCVECSDTFHLQSSYKSHISTHFVKQVKCNLCQETFTQTKSLERHKKRHHRPGVVCVECGKSCPSRRELVGHMVNHTGVRVFQCLYCGEGFCRSNGRSVHMRKMHTNFIPHQCTICSEKIYTAHKLKIHMKSHYSTRQKKYECNDCGKRFLLRTSMVPHAKRHAENIRYYCPMCERSYSTYHNLSVHAESAHVNIERHKCELCNASFILESMLRRHYRSRNHQNKVYAAHLRSINVKE